MEFNASNRAVALLSDYGFWKMMNFMEQKVLKAAALTYVAAATAIANYCTLWYGWILSQS